MDVVLYIADTLRADHLSCYGYGRSTTTRIDDLATDGVRFERCFAPATWTRPVAASLLTGWYPPAHGTEGRGDTLPEDVPVIGDCFREAGFATACVTAMGNVSSATGFDRGFDDCIEVYKQPEVVRERRTTTSEREELRQSDTDLLAYPRAADLNGALFDWLDDHEDEDTFVLVWAIDPHMPYDPPADADWFLDPDYDGDPDLGREPGTLADAATAADFDRLRDLYDCCIRYLDAQVGALADWLRDRGRYDDAVIGFAGDHGESFGERTLVRNPIRGHSSAPYDEQIHVPFVLKTPDEDEVGTEDGLRSLVDVPATLLDASGLDPALLDAQTRSGLSEPGREQVFARTNITEASERYSGVRTADEKYIGIDPPPLGIESLRERPRRVVGLRLLAETEQLYDLATDPGERTNLATSSPGRCAEFRDRLEAWLAECKRADIGATGDLADRTTEEQLKALGYR
jgi:arylsulfatase A-like enzyme